MHGGEPAVAAPERRSDGFDDDDVVVGESRPRSRSSGLGRWTRRIVVPGCENRPVSHSHSFRASSSCLLTAAIVPRASCVAATATTTTPVRRSTPATTEAPDAETTAPPTTPQRPRPRQPRPRRRRAPCPPLDGGTIGRDQSRSRPTGPPASPASRSRRGDCTDIVTFTFDADGARCPGYQIAYQPGPFTQDGSGEPVPVAGGAFLVVRFEPAYGYDFEAGDDTYTGPDRVTLARCTASCTRSREDRRLRSGRERG